MYSLTESLRLDDITGLAFFALKIHKYSYAVNTRCWHMTNDKCFKWCVLRCLAELQIRKGNVEAVLMTGHKLCLHGKIRKIIPKSSPLPLLTWSSGYISKYNKAIKPY